MMKHSDLPGFVYLFFFRFVVNHFLHPISLITVGINLYLGLDLYLEVSTDPAVAETARTQYRWKLDCGGCIDTVISLFLFFSVKPGLPLEGVGFSSSSPCHRGKCGRSHKKL